MTYSLKAYIKHAQSSWTVKHKKSMKQVKTELNAREAWGNIKVTSRSHDGLC